MDEQNAQTESHRGLMQVHDADSCLMATDDSNIVSEQQQQQYKTNPSSPVQSREASQSVPTFAVYTSESKPTSASHPTQLKLAGYLDICLFYCFFLNLFCNLD